MLDLNQFAGGFNLEKAMDEFRNNMTYGGKTKFYDVLKNGKYLMPSREGNSIPLISPTKENNFLPVFTNVEEMEKQGNMGENDLKIMSFKDILNTFVEHYPKITGIALNPFGKTLFLGKEQIDDIERLTEGMTLRRTDYEKSQELLPWEHTKGALKNDIQRYCQKEKAVTRAWIVGARSNKSEEPHIQFLLEFSGVKREKIFTKVAEIVKVYMLPGQSFELMQATVESANKADLISKAVYDIHTVNLSEKYFLGKRRKRK